MNAAAIDNEIQQRFTEWANAYGGEQLQREGYSSLDRIGDPSANDEEYSPARKMELIVRSMEQSGRWKEARVLRAEYFMASLPEAVRLLRLRRLGLSISRASYYIYLDAARAYVSGALSSKQ